MKSEKPLTQPNVGIRRREVLAMPLLLLPLTMTTQEAPAQPQELPLHQADLYAPHPWLG